MDNYIIVSGNIGVGKTTLVQKLGEYFNWHTVFESVTDNPYLEDFYSNMKYWSFHLQIYFLSCRIKQYLEASKLYKSIIMDRSIYEDVNVFLPALYDLGNITKRDVDTVLQTYNIVHKILPLPNLLIYLKAPINTIMQRINKRGLNFDYKNISRDYLELINSYYEKWVEQYKLSPILILDTKSLNYIEDNNCLKYIAELIVEKL